MESDEEAKSASSSDTESFVSEDGDRNQIIGRAGQMLVNPPSNLLGPALYPQQVRVYVKIHTGKYPSLKTINMLLLN